MIKMQSLHSLFFEPVDRQLLLPVNRVIEFPDAPRAITHSRDWLIPQGLAPLLALAIGATLVYRSIAGLFAVLLVFSFVELLAALLLALGLELTNGVRASFVI
mgnify:CR=1 FL=1